MGCEQSQEERFEEIYLKYKDIVYRTSLHYTRNECEAEDIMQKIFCRLFEYLSQVDEERLEGYLVTAAKNMSYNWLRDTKREREGIRFEELADNSVVTYSAEDLYLNKEKEEEIRGFSADLMDQIREENESWYHIINLIYGLGVSHEDTAKMLGVSNNVLYSKLYRAKKWIRKHFPEKLKGL